MYEIERKLIGRDFRDHAEHPLSHRSLPPPTQRSRALTSPGDAPSRQPTYANSRSTCGTDERLWNAKFSDITGFDPRESSYVCGPNDFSDSESTAGRTTSSSVGFEQSTTQSYLFIPQLSIQEDDLYHRVRNRASGFSAAMLPPECAKDAEALKRNSKALYSGRASERESSTTAAYSAVPSTQPTWRGMNDSTPSLTVRDCHSEPIHGPISTRSQDIQASVWPGPVSVPVLEDALSRNERTSRSAREEILNECAIGQLQLHHGVQALSSTSCTSDHDPAPDDAQPKLLPRHGSAISNGSNVSAYILPSSRADPMNNNEIIKSPTWPRLAPRTVKRHAGEMVPDNSKRASFSRRPPPRSVQHGHRRAFSLDAAGPLQSGCEQEAKSGQICETQFLEQDDPLFQQRCASSSTDLAPLSASTVSECLIRSESGSQQQILLQCDATEPIIVESRASPSNCQAWLSNQPEECKDVDQRGPIETPSTVYHPESLEMGEIDCRGTSDAETSCSGVISMCTYLAGKGYQHASGTATWQDAEDMLEELTLLNLTGSVRKDGLYLHQLVELIPDAAKEAQKEIDATAINAWLFAFQMNNNDAMESDTLLEGLLLVCIGMCDLGVTVFRLACFVAGLIRSLSEMSSELNAQNINTGRGHTPSSSWSSGNGSSHRVYAGYDNPGGSSPNAFETSGSGNTGTVHNANGKRQKCGGQDQEGDDFEAEQPGAEGNDQDESGGKASVAIPCVAEQCTATHPFISVMIRCLRKHNYIVCNKCWGHFQSEKSFEGHLHSQRSHTLDQSGTGDHGVRPACESHCVSACNSSADTENSHSANTIKNRRHKYDKQFCSRTRSPELRSAQWRYLYAITHPDCTRVPDLVVQRKKPKRKPIDQILSSALPGSFHPSSSDSAVLLALQIANKELQAERKHLIDFLEMSLPHLAENDTAASLALHKCISARLFESSTNMQTGSSSSSNNEVGQRLAAPLTPRSNIRNKSRLSANAAPLNAIAIDNYQNTTPVTPANRVMAPRFPAPEIQSFPQRETAPPAYQHQMLAARQSAHFPMQVPLVQPQGTWSLPQVNPTDCGTPQFNGSGQQLPLYDFNAQQGTQFADPNDPFISFSGFGGCGQGNQQHYQ